MIVKDDIHHAILYRFDYIEKFLSKKAIVLKLYI